MAKLDRIEQEIKKTRAKITEYQNKLKGLEAQKTEQENLEIVQLVRATRFSPQELTEFLQSAAVTPTAQAAATVTNTDYDYDTTQEDSEDEE